MNRFPVMAALLAGALVPLSAPAAAAGSVKDPEFSNRQAAIRKQLRSLPEPQPLPANAGSEYISPGQYLERKSLHEKSVEEYVAPIREFAATKDSRVFEDLVKLLGPIAREMVKSALDLEEATVKREKVLIPYFDSIRAEKERTGKYPETILVSTRTSLNTVEWALREASYRHDLLFRIRMELEKGLAANLELLGEDRSTVWKDALRFGVESKDPMDRISFCEASHTLTGPEVEQALLEIEAKESDPRVLMAVLDALSIRGSKEGFERLRKRVGATDWQVAVAAIRGVARYRHRETVPILAERMKSAEGRVMADLSDVLFNLTGKHLPDAPGAWTGWWEQEGAQFLKRWDEDPEVRIEQIEAISYTDPRKIDVPAELSALLPTEKDPKVRDAILENLSLHRSDFARRTLVRALDDPSKDTRVAAIRGLSAYRHLSVPEELIRVLSRADPDEVQAIWQSLRTLWGARDFDVKSPDKEALLRWWDTNKGRVERQFDKLNVSAEEMASSAQQRGDLEGEWRDRNFYGLKIVTDKVLFIVDISLSMEEPAKKTGGGSFVADDPGGKKTRKIDVAKAELTRALRSLPDGTLFGLILFSVNEEVWDQGLVEMNSTTRKKALEWVDALKTREATNVYDALEAGFEIGTPKSKVRAAGTPDTIFFVSDGQPTVGKFLDPKVIKDHIREWNKTRNIKIHVIGVGDEHDKEFCRSLAEENGGYYVAR